jgi:hypothetical protein
MSSYLVVPTYLMELWWNFSPCLRWLKDEIYMLLGEILSNERKKGYTFSYSAKSDVWTHPYPHIICICTTFYFLTFPFLTPFHYTILHQP